MAQFLEVMMMIAFGASWPNNIAKSLQSRTTTGKSFAFMCLIQLGYIFGLASKLVGGQINYVVGFYLLNMSMVTIDMCLYRRNWLLDREREQEAKKKDEENHTFLP